MAQKKESTCGKGSGQTNHVERFNNTLRQRLGRLVSLILFPHGYSRRCAIRHNTLSYINASK